VGTTVTLVVSELFGEVKSVTTPGLSGTPARASATVTIPSAEPAVITASATFARTAARGDAPAFAEGEPVELVRIVTAAGGASRVALVTASGREIWVR
jgi:hypothetical protein